jgi:NAD(P)-dependent dehydrogenase (short-subunit alcohol dehydrogenase family)
MKQPDFSVQDRVALLTGSARGIGLAIAQALAAGGASVVIQDIDHETARAEANAIVAAGGRAVGIGGDCTDLDIAPVMVEQAVAAFGRVDILVNNAGIQAGSRFLDYPVDEMLRQSNCNMILPVRLCQLVLPGMIERKWGRIINISSIQSVGGNPGMPVYAMTKSAIENLTRGLGRHYAKHGITVNQNEFRTEADLVENGRRVPAGRVGFPEDCAGAAILLCSRAGEYITGKTITIDGGMSTR